MGLKFDQMLACSNVNKIVPEYLERGTFNPRPSQMTISNAMDVGNPSNFARMNEWYSESVENMRRDISGYWYDDHTTGEALKKVYVEKNYLMDPHGSIGYLGLKEYQQKYNVTGIFLETAHPAKFIDVVEETIGESIEIPPKLKSCLDRQKEAVEMNADFEQLKQFLLS